MDWELAIGYVIVFCCYATAMYITFNHKKQDYDN